MTFELALFAAIVAAVGAVLGWFTDRIVFRVCQIHVRAPAWLTALITAAVLAVVVSTVGWVWSLAAYVWLACVGCILAIVDLEHRRLPDRLTLPSYPAVGLLLLLPAIFSDQWGAYGRAWLGALGLFLLYLVLALISPAGMGMGDVKLAGVLGLALGFAGWPYVIIGGFAGFLLGAVFGVGLLLVRKAGRKSAIPFGPFMLGGALLALVWAGTIANWYLTRLTI